jgi:NADH-quinone oxidoreductase subunit J
MSGSEILVNAVFYLMAALAVGGSLLVAGSRNIVRSAFSLLAVLFAAAGLYAIMKADFIAAAQVLIYVGGILVLIIFAVMLTHRITDVNISNDSTPGPAAFCACLCLLFSLVVVVLFTTRWKRDPEETVVRAGPQELVLFQYQGDGRTGLARGGDAVEGHVVLGVRVASPPKGATDVAFKIGDREDVTVPLGPEGTALYDLKNLPEGKYKWRAKLKAQDADLTPLSPPVVPDADFTVYRGITEPIAIALAGPYLLAFEAISVLLLAALVGAAFLARKEVRE